MNFDPNTLLLKGGGLLFYLSLLQGLTIYFSKNRRMALSGHTAGAQTGMVVMIVAFSWPWVSLNPTLANVCELTILWGTYLLWAGIGGSALTGASRALPMAGEGYEAKPLLEHLMTLLVYSGTLLQLVGFGLWLWGLI